MKITKWEVSNPTACVQIVHGAKEHIKRYHDFAKYLNSKNISVYGHNNQGHGDRLKNTKYIFKDKKKLYTEINEFSKLILKHNENIPLILIGHSMGAAFAKLAYDTDSKLYSKLILIGLPNPRIYQLKFIDYINNEKIFKADETSHLLDFLFFNNFEIRVRLKGYKKNWLCSDPLQVKYYDEDVKCGYLFTNSALKMYTQVAFGVGFIQNDVKKIPILVLCGECDPVTSFGTSSLRIKNSFIKNGYCCNLKIYKEMKHEILNEINKEIVFNDIVEFIQKET